MRKVLITREKGIAAKLIELLASHGVTGVPLSVSEMYLVSPQHEIPDPGYFKSILFTSANAVNFTADILSASNIPISPTMILLAVGEATGTAIMNRYNRIPDLVGNTGFDNLADQIIVRFGVSASPILWPSARVVASEVAYLDRFGIAVKRWVVYETCPIPVSRLKDEIAAIGKYDAVFITAPSAAASLVQVEGMTGKPCVAIGKTTERAMRQLGWKEIVVANSPTESECVNAILKCLNQINN